VRKLLAHGEEYVAGVLLAAVTLLIVVQLVLGRMAPRLASPLTTLVLALFFWATLLGVCAATRQGAHLSLVWLSRRLSARGRRVLGGIVLAATLAFFVALAATGVMLCVAQARWHNRFLGTWCPDWAISASIPLAAALSCVRAVEAWRAEREPAREP
jgi:TRAP-type C4-dicarboxylate transport system permease small subunit